MSNLPVTPTQPASSDNPSSQFYDSTPIQLKLASDAFVQSDNIDPPLRIDLVNPLYEIPLDDFINKFLGVPPSDMCSLQEAFKVLGEETDITDAVNAYLGAGDELALYVPFSKLTNHILARVPAIKPDLRSFPVDLTFVRNDPTLIQSPNASQKPGVVGVSKRRIEGLREEYKGSTSSSVSETPPNIRWVDICVLVEFGYSLDAKFNISDFNTGSFLLPPPSISTTTSGLDTLPSTLPKISGHFKRKAEGPPSDAPEAKKRLLSQEAKPVFVEATAACAGCAAELMASTGGTRVHVWCMSLIGSTMRLSVYDASGAMHTASFDFLREFSKFAAIVVTIASFDRERWGVQTAVKYPPNSDTIPVSLQGSTLSFDICGLQEVLTIGNEISCSSDGLGRNTNVHEGDCEGFGHRVAVKFSQPRQSRAWSEWDIIQRAKDSGIEGIPEFRREIFGLLDLEAPYEDRWMIILVSKLYRPMSELSGDKYLKPFQDAVRCHHNLYKSARILHRDISIGNLMYDVRDNIRYGILNDYDNAIILDQESNPQAPLPKHPTGTLPFMAIDLLKPNTPVQHLYRHDLESFFYVILWTAVFFPREGRNKTSAATLTGWCNGSARQIYAAKHSDNLEPSMVESLTFTDSFHALTDVLTKLHFLFCMGHWELKHLAMLERRGLKRMNHATPGDEAPGNTMTFAQFNEVLTHALSDA